MDTCLFRGEQICAYDVVNDNFAMNYKLDKEWKIAGKNGELICEDCGTRVIFKARNIRKKVPHFAHKNTNRNCYYNNESIVESENHKRGKMLLYTYFKKLYPNEEIAINHRFDFNRRADVYIEFSNGKKLAVEYQRSELYVEDWEDKHRDYKENGINTVWVQRGNYEKLEGKSKQIELSFFQRVMLNEVEKQGLYLDVDKEIFILSKNLRYTDANDFSKDYEELFIRPYVMDDVRIKPDGEIRCDFKKEYDKASEEFIKAHDMDAIRDRKIKEAVGKKGEEFQQIQFSFFDDIEDREEPKRVRPKKTIEKKVEKNSGNKEVKIDKKKEEGKPEVVKPKVEGTKEQPFVNSIYNALNGSEKSKEYIIKYIIERASSSDMKLFKFISSYNYLNKNMVVSDMFEEVMKRTGMGNGEMNPKEDSAEEMLCPLCGGNTIRICENGKRYVSCEEYPKCNLFFRI